MVCCGGVLEQSAVQRRSFTDRRNLSVANAHRFDPSGFFTSAGIPQAVSKCIIENDIRNGDDISFIAFQEYFYISVIF